MRLVVGLGNPGREYDGTRHNVGFQVLACLAARQNVNSTTTKFESELAEIVVAGEKLILAAPQTYMNASGRAVRKICDFYKLDLNDIVVVCDDLNLDLGRLRWRAAGSAGGQKGLNDIINKMQSQDIPRLRIGIGRPPGRMDSSQYVLGRFRSSQRETIDHTIEIAADSIELWAQQDLATVMNQYNVSEN